MNAHDLKNGQVRLPQDVAHLGGYASMGSTTAFGAAAPSYLDVQDGGGWTFRVTPDGKLTIIAGPTGVGTVYAPGSAAYETVLTRLRARDPRIDAVLGAVVPPNSEDASTFITGLLNQLGVGAGQGTKQAEAMNPEGAAEQKTQVGSMLSSLFAQYGEGAAAALQTAFLNRAESLDVLLKKLARKRVDYAKATKPRRRAVIAAEISGLEAQIRRLQATQASAQAQLTAPPPAPSAFPAWIPFALAGGLLLVGIAVVARK